MSLEKLKNLRNFVARVVLCLYFIIAVLFLYLAYIQSDSLDNVIYAIMAVCICLYVLRKD